MIGDSWTGAPGGRSDPDWRDVVSDTWDTIVDTVRDVLEAIWTWVERIIEIVRWVRAIVTEIYAVPMERWDTRADERTCPECGSKAGAIFEEGTGDTPPLHANCRCRRVFAFIEWRTRNVAFWQRQVDHVITGEWQITGWA